MDCRCKRCGSYGINPHLHGRDETALDLCDVCFWRAKAEAADKVIRQLVGDADGLREVQSCPKT